MRRIIVPSRPLMPVILALLLTLAACLDAWAAEGRRLALVIGNDAYRNITVLKKAVNDATALGEALQNAGFSVTRKTDLDRRQMNRAIQDFVAQVEAGDVAMLFYAGHGVEIAGKNYLLPVDVPDASGADAEFIQAESIALDDVLERLRQKEARLNLLILDACRNNPFRSGTRSLGGNAGLARIAAPQGTFVMYSADVGEAALDRLGEDDPDPNSVFTRTLIPLLDRNDLDLVDTAREVRRQVRSLALTVRHQQTPAYYDAVLGDFFFSRSATGDTPRQDETAGNQDSSGKDADADSLALLDGTKEPREKPQLREPQSNGSQSDASQAPIARAMVVTGGEKDTIRLWDAEEGRMISELEGEKIVLSTIKFTHGGKRLAVAGEDGALFSYSLPDFKKQNALYPGFRVTAVAELPGGDLLAGGRGGEMARINLGDFTIAWKQHPHDDIISPVLVLEGGETAITASGDGTMAVIATADGKVLSRIRTLPGKEITDIAHLSATTVVAVHEDGTIALVNLSSGRVLSGFRGAKGWISSVAFLENGVDYVTANVDGTLSFFSIGQELPYRRVQGHRDLSSGAKFMTVGGQSRMVSAGFDGSLKIWDGSGELVEADLDHGSAILHFDLVSR
ncbi:MAG: caspase family protein [Rhizobiaceae bacterium]